MYNAMVDVCSRGKKSGKASTSMGFGVFMPAPPGTGCCCEVVSNPLEDRSNTQRDTP